MSKIVIIQHRISVKLFLRHFPLALASRTTFLYMLSTHIWVPMSPFQELYAPTQFVAAHVWTRQVLRALWPQIHRSLLPSVPV